MQNALLRMVIPHSVSRCDIDKAEYLMAHATFSADRARWQVRNKLFEPVKKIGPDGCFAIFAF